MRPAENPFRSAAIERLPFIGESLELLFEKWRTQDWRGEITGAHGTGKSTLLMQLCDLAVAGGFRVQTLLLRYEGGKVVREGDSRFSDPAAFRFIDGADLLPWRERRILRRAPRILAASHATLGLPRMYACRSSPQILSQLILKLGAGPCPPSLSAELLGRHGGNIRDVFWELFDVYGPRAATKINSQSSGTTADPRTCTSVGSRSTPPFASKTTMPDAP